MEKCDWLVTERDRPYVLGLPAWLQWGFCRIYAGLAASGRRGSAGKTWPDFVDSASIFQYSKDLARCCAWGLCGCMPDPVGGFSLRGSACNRPPAAGHNRSGRARARDRANSPQSSPEQICLAVGRFWGPCVFRAGESGLRWRDCGGMPSAVPKCEGPGAPTGGTRAADFFEGRNDVDLCSERQGCEPQVVSD